MSKVRVGENDFGTLHPDLATEWHPTLNGNLLPSDIAAMSHKKAWWKCSKGHVWQTSISVRSNGSGCPYCAGNLPILGETDFATLHPELVTEWHPTLNGDLCPSNVTVKSSKKVWWKCSKGHEWQAIISDRSNGSRCPYCTGKIMISRETDLATLHPELVAEWHPTLNGNLLPSDVTAKSHKKVWWKCSKGHEWQAYINNRSRESGCPYCSGLFPILGETDLATLRPELAAEWHPTLNENLSPRDVMVMTNKKVWWKCSKGHVWQAAICDRANGRGCPYCAGKKPISGETDLATLRPELAAEWHPTLNKDYTPCDFTVKSGKKVWWRCFKGHEWQAAIDKRSNGNGCPYCAGHLAIPGKTDLATLRPDLALEWHPTLNKNLSPRDVTVMANKMVWWICSEGHEWQASIAHRSSGNGCPYCAGKIKYKQQSI